MPSDEVSLWEVSLWEVYLWEVMRLLTAERVELAGG